MKKLAAVVVFALVVYYFVYSNNDRVEKAKVTNQLETEDRVLDYDIKYKDAVKDINEAVDLNLEKHDAINEIVNNTQPVKEPGEAGSPDL